MFLRRKERTIFGQVFGYRLSSEVGGRGNHLFLYITNLKRHASVWAVYVYPVFTCGAQTNIGKQIGAKSGGGKSVPMLAPLMGISLRKPKRRFPGNKSLGERRGPQQKRFLGRGKLLVFFEKPKGHHFWKRGFPRLVGPPLSGETKGAQTICSVQGSYIRGRHNEGE